MSYINDSDRGNNYVGPVRLVRKIDPNLTEAAAQTDPYLRALEARYAQDAAAAQNLVNDAATRPGADFIYGDPKQKMAAQLRQRLIAAAAMRYNAGLPGGSMTPRKDIAMNPFWGP